MVARTSYLALLAVASSTPALAADGDRVSPYLLFQAWGTALDQDEDPQADPAGYGDPEHDPGVLIRRARIGLDGRYGIVDFRVSVGTGAAADVWFEDRPLIGVVDAYAGLSWAAGPGSLRLSAGTQKVPVSRELLISSGDLLFQERAVATNHLAPGREAGVLVDYAADFGGRVRIGAFNGNANILGDDNYGVLAAARLEYADGDAYTTWSPEPGNAWGVGLSAMYNDDVATAEARLGADALVRMGAISVLVEGAFSDLRPTGDTIDEPDVQVQTTRLGGLVQVSGAVPMNQGAIEIGARGELFDDATRVDDNGDIALLFAGASWRDAVPGLDVGLGFVHRQELKGRTLSNDTVRLWIQVEVPRRGATTAGTGWATGFAGAWAGSGDLDGVVLQLDPSNGGLVGTVRTPDGELAMHDLAWNAAQRTLLAKVDTDRLGRVWVELAPEGNSALCGWAYEEGRREEAVTTGQGGRFVCWQAL